MKNENWTLVIKKVEKLLDKVRVTFQRRTNDHKRGVSISHDALQKIEVTVLPGKSLQMEKNISLTNL